MMPYKTCTSNSESIISSKKPALSKKPIYFPSESGLVAFGPCQAVGIDGDNCLILGCFSYYHCTMMVEYGWFFNGTPLKKGRKTNLVYVTQPGQYQCVVSVSEHVAKSQVIDVVVVEETNNQIRSRATDLLAHQQSDINNQGIIIKNDILGESNKIVIISIVFVSWLVNLSRLYFTSANPDITKRVMQV